MDERDRRRNGGHGRQQTVLCLTVCPAKGENKRVWTLKNRLTSSEFRDNIFIFNLVNKNDQTAHELASRPKNPTVTISSCAPLFSHIINATGKRY